MSSQCRCRIPVSSTRVRGRQRESAEAILPQREADQYRVLKEFPTKAEWPPVMFDDRTEMQLLIDRTDGRANLEVLCAVYTQRLHRRSDDFAATFGLRLVIAKLQRTSYGSPLITTSS